MTDPGDASRGGGDGWHSFFDDRVHVSAGCDIPNALWLAPRPGKQCGEPILSSSRIA